MTLRGRPGPPQGAGPPSCLDWLPWLLILAYCALLAAVRWLLRLVLPVLGGAAAVWIITGMPALRW